MRTPFSYLLLALVIACGMHRGTSTAQTNPAAPTFPAPELVTTCEPARLLAGQVDGKLGNAQVAVYELRALTLCLSELGALHAATLGLMRNLGITYSVLGQYEKARVIEEQLLALRRAKVGNNHPDTVAAMNSLARTHWTLNQFDKALDLYEQVLKARQLVLGPDHLDTLLAMNNVGLCLANIGQLEKSALIRKQLLQLRIAKQGVDHADTLEVMNSLADLYSKLGQFENALMLDQQSLKLIQAKHGNEHIDALSTMGNMATAYLSLGDFKQALSIQEQVLNIARGKFGENHPSTLIMMSNLAVTYNEVAQHDKALALNEQTLKLRRISLGADHALTLISLNNVASTYFYLGQVDKALPLQELALNLRRASLGVDHVDTISSMNNLANSLNSLGQFDKSVALKEQALQLMRVKLGVNHPFTMAVQSNLASAFGDRGQYDQAFALNQQTLIQRRAVLGEDHPDVLISINNLAKSHSDLKQYEQARALNEQALLKTRAKFAEDHPRTLIAMSNLAVQHVALKQFDKALLLNEQTLKLRRARLGNENLETIFSMNNFAISLYAVGQYSRVFSLVEEVKQGIEKLRELDLSTDSKQSVFARYSDDYQRYSAWYAEQRKYTEGFEIGDLSKARSLADSIRGQSAIATLPMADRNILARLQNELLLAQKKSDNLAEQAKPSTQSILLAQKEVDVARAELLQLQAALKANNAKYAQLISLRPALVKQAATLLNSSDVFINYLVHVDGAIQVYVLDKNAQPMWISLGAMPNLTSTVSAYRELVVTASGAGSAATNLGAATSALRAAARRLNVGDKLVVLKEGGYQWLTRGQPMPQGANTAAQTPADALLVLNKYLHDKLIKPMIPLAGGMKRWIISPDKDLALLPFDTLVEEFDAKGDIGKIVAQNRNVTIVQSFAVYALLKQREKEYAQLARPKELMAMGNPVYADGWVGTQTASQGDSARDEGARSFEPIERGSTASTAPLKPAAEQYALTRGTWKNLPGTAREVIAVAKSFGASDVGSTTGSATVDVFTGTDASEPKMLSMQAQGKLKDYKYLLFSAHGYLAQNPSLSALVLTQQGNPEGIDGYITAAKWPSYDIRSDLTVLSACDTGVGKTQAGEGVMGLPYALFIAGNKNTLLSLWPVDDDATAEFMSRFFARLKAGQVQPEALSKTKLEFMQHAKWSAPKYWAAFVLYGV